MACGVSAVELEPSTRARASRPRDGSKGGRMSQHRSTDILKKWGLLIVGSLACLSLLSIAKPITFDSPWIIDEGLCISTGDVPVCETSFTSQEMSAIGSLNIIADQDSPLFGKTSRAEKQIQFKRTFTAEASIKVALFAELTGTLRIEGGMGEVVVRAAAVVLDAVTLVPVAGMKIGATTVPDRFDRSIDEPGTLELKDSGVQVATFPAGTYIVLGSIEATAEMARGWWNREAEVDVSLSVEFLAGTDESTTPEVDSSSAD